jgi:hypothetical protein
VEYIVVRTKDQRRKCNRIERVVYTCEWMLLAVEPGRSRHFRRRKDGYNPVVLGRERVRNLPRWMEQATFDLRGMTLEEARAHMQEIGR